MPPISDQDMNAMLAEESRVNIYFCIHNTLYNLFIVNINF